MTERVLIELENGILTIRFNRPKRKNALTPEMFVKICDGMDRAASDPDIRVLVFMGEGGDFTSGNDVSAFPAKPSPGEETLPYRFVKGLINSPVPVIAGVDGVTAGIGATMLLLCDAVIATPETRFILPFLKMALVPEAGSSLILPELLGYTRAADLLLSGEPLDGTRLSEFGIATKIVGSKDLVQVVADKAAHYARLPRAAVERTRRLLKGDTSRLLQRVEEEQTELFKCFASEEHKEAVTAFIEKRAPDFSKY